MSENKTFQQVIEGWRDAAATLEKVASGPLPAPVSMSRAQLFGACADEASLVLERLRALVQEWRERSANFVMQTGNPAKLELDDCINALEQIIGPEPSGGDR